MKKDILRGHAKESPLDKINNIEYSQISFWGRIFGFSNLDIQTAAEMGKAVMEVDPSSNF